MTYPTTLIVAVLLCSTAAAAPQEVTCESPCSCSSAHGKGRWSVKNDPETPPTDTSTFQAVTPSDIFSWAGPDVHQQSKRTGLEQKWFAVTGRVVAAKVEADGDLRPSGAENIKTIAVLALDIALANEVNAAT